MSRIHSKDTKPELVLRKILWRKGHRYRKNYKELPGSPDIVFLKKKIAIFIDGDFWHGNNWRIRGLKNREDEFADDKREYWIDKINKNIKRDNQNNNDLIDMGYEVLRFWESNVMKNIDDVILKIEDLFHSKR